MLHRVGHTQKTQNENHPHLLKVDVSNDGQTLAFTTTNTTHRLTLETKKSQEFPKEKKKRKEIWGAAVTCLASTEGYIEMRLI